MSDAPDPLEEAERIVDAEAEALTLEESYRYGKTIRALRDLIDKWNLLHGDSQ